MVSSQSSQKESARQRRAHARSSRSLSSRNRRDDAIKSWRSFSQSSSSIQLPGFEKKLIVNLIRHPLIKQIVETDKNQAAEKSEGIKDKRLDIMPRGDFGDAPERTQIESTSTSKDIMTENTDNNSRNMTELTVRIERMALIDDMLTFSKIKSTIMKTPIIKKKPTVTLLSIPSQSIRNNVGPTTPLLSPEIWPLTPSPAILSNMPSFSRTTVPAIPQLTSSTCDANEGSGEPRNVPNRRRRHAIVPHKVTYRDAISIRLDQLEILCTQPHKCGSFTDLCQYCGALFFTQEKVSRDGDHSSCCNKGAYSLPALSTCPSTFKELYTGNGPLAVQFRKRIRYLNSLFAMASFKTSRPMPERSGQGHWSFTVCGQIYHFLNPIPNSQDMLRPRLNQIYFLDVEEALQRRNVFADDDVNPELLRKIENCLRQNNVYIQAYKTMGEELIERRRNNQEVENIVLGMTAEPVINILAAQHDPNWRPGRSDIAAVFEGSEPPIEVDLVLYPHRENDPESRNRHHELKLLNPMADPMVYPLLFPCGDNGYRTDIRYNERAQRRTRKIVTIIQYYRYRLYLRDTFSILHHGGKLFQQYIVDGWIKHEMNRLWWIRQHQNQLRRTAEDTLRRYNRNRLDGHVGRAIILPSGFPGGERYRYKEYMDAMAIVARIGKPDLFITFTCNPNWPEVRNNLMPNQKWEDRPDLICRVFQIKLLAFMNDVVNQQVYGVVISHQYVIEFQKRGLPHAHIVLTFHDDDKLKTVEEIDNIISAQIPDREIQPLLYRRVKDFQLHGPCGILNPNASCLRDGKCSKYYPKPYRNETAFAVGRNKTPEYKRPADGREIFVEKWNRSITNRRVVPYNAYALAKYNCHINFEVVGSLNSIKYLHKYINKGEDSIQLYVDTTSSAEHPNARRIDEIQDYIDRRYVSGMEATWRTFEFSLHKRSHSIMFLPLHLPGERDMCYDEEDDIVDVEERLMKRSKLEAWFSLNERDSDARRFRYVEIPEHYVWDDKRASWNRRLQKSKQFGRLQEVATTEGIVEKFFLRVLLKRTKGATCFDDLLTLEDGRKCSTFRESCQKRNWLIREGNEFKNCLEEAESQYHPYRLRKLFALICCVAMEEDVGQIAELWQQFKKSLMADLRRRGLNCRHATDACLRLIQDIISRSRPGVILQNLGIGNEEENELISDEEESLARRVIDENDEINRTEQIQRDKYSISSLNVDQRMVFLRVLNVCARKMKFSIPTQILEDLNEDIDNMSDLLEDRGNMFYLDGPGGTGKTHLYNTLIKIMEDIFHMNVIAVAWTGIAANILIGGTTVHRAFKLPLTLSEESTCGFEIQSPRTELIKKAALIIWDEAPMTPRYAMETIDRYLKDTMRLFEPMGGKCVLFGGDFRQILPVVPGGRRHDIITQSLKASVLWKNFVKLKLTKNMRVAHHPEMAITCEDLHNLTFDKWLLMLGEGRLPYLIMNRKSAPVAPDNLIEIPKRFQVTTIDELIRFVYDGDYTARENGNRAILCPTNAIVDSINGAIMQQIETGEAKVYMSEDSYVGTDEDDEFLAPLDLLNSMNPPSLPPHELILKCGAIVMLLRNLDVDQGECNGSRLRIIRLGDHTIECELLTGQRVGEKLILPRMKMKVQIPALPREMIRLQFPIRLAYGMTINKSQGQTLSRVGICLKKPCFTHGQLYVAFSRVGNINDVKIYIEDSGKQGTFKFRGRKRFTSNIVFQNIIENETDLENGSHSMKRPTLIDENLMQTDEQNPNDQVKNLNDPPEQNSDPDYRYETSDTDESIFGNINLDDICRPEEKGKGETINKENEFWKESTPYRTRNQLEARISVYDKPGTSGLNIRRTPYEETTDSDSD